MGLHETPPEHRIWEGGVFKNNEELYTGHRHPAKTLINPKTWPPVACRIA